jgi:putative RecB family exonuclease
MLSYAPDEQDLRSTERQLDALWAAISRAHETGDWRPSKSRLCDWCSFKDFCPEFGGELLPLPASADQLNEAGEVEPGE